MDINLKAVYSKFPTGGDCLQYLETLRWEGQPQCPYCGSERHTVLAKEGRYHCNGCNTNYSVTAKTVFHKTRVELQKWFLIITHVMTRTRNQKRLSARQIAETIGVNKNTACYMAMRIRVADQKDNDLFLKIADEVTRQ